MDYDITVSSPLLDEPIEAKVRIHDLTLLDDVAALNRGLHAELASLARDLADRISEHTIQPTVETLMQLLGNRQSSLGYHPLRLEGRWWASQAGVESVYSSTARGALLALLDLINRKPSA